MARTYEPDPHTIALGVELRADMDAQGISVTDMAARIGVDRGTLGDWLGARRPMPVPMLWQLAAALRVPEEEIVQRTKDRVRRDARREL